MILSSVVKHVASGVGGLGFGSRASQIGHSVNSSPLLRRFCVAQALSGGDGLTTHYTLRRDITIVMEI